MEPRVETFLPSLWFARTGWFALASAVGLGFFVPGNPLFLPAIAFSAAAAVALLWLSARPVIQIRESQMSVGERSVIWREIEAVGRIRLAFPLILRFKLTNARKLTVIFPGTSARAKRLMGAIRDFSRAANHERPPARDQLIWLDKATAKTSAALVPSPQAQKQLAAPAPAERPAPLFSLAEEAEIERMFLKLKTVGSLDSLVEPAQSDED